MRVREAKKPKLGKAFADSGLRDFGGREFLAALWKRLGFFCEPKTGARP
jgi:hypothetical protein